MSPELVIIGPMGSGKTRIGKRIAKLLGVGFTDTDALVVAEHGPISDLFEAHGEAHFRVLEREAVQRALATDGVVSLGGGAVLDPATQNDLASRRTALFLVSPEAVASRLGNERRPLVKDGLASWTRIMDERRALYERLADATFDTSHRPTVQVAEEVAAWVRQTA
jgi:shikimate kinase